MRYPSNCRSDSWIASCELLEELAAFSAGVLAAATRVHQKPWSWPMPPIGHLQLSQTSSALIRSLIAQPTIRRVPRSTIAAR